jgi:hypothetical protein
MPLLVTPFRGPDSCLPRGGEGMSRDRPSNGAAPGRAIRPEVASLIPTVEGRKGPKASPDVAGRCRRSSGRPPDRIGSVATEGGTSAGRPLDGGLDMFLDTKQREDRNRRFKIMTAVTVIC